MTPLKRIIRYMTTEHVTLQAEEVNAVDLLLNIEATRIAGLETIMQRRVAIDALPSHLQQDIKDKLTVIFKARKL